jgi:hypothetical protein
MELLEGKTLRDGIAMSASEGGTNRRLRLYLLAAAGGTSRILDVGRYNVVVPLLGFRGTIHHL